MTTIKRGGLAKWALALLATAAGLTAGVPATRGLYLEPEAQASITATAISERWSGRGFMPVRIRVENRADEARAWEFSFNANRGYSSHATAYSAAIGAEAGGASETVVFVPGGAADVNQGVSLSLFVNGPGATASSTSFMHTRAEAIIVTATTPALETALFAATNGAPGARTEISAVDPAFWPADWRVWSPFQRVVLTRDEHAALDGPRRAALRDWVALGGVLELYPTGGGGESRIERIGHGMIRHRATSLADEAKQLTQVQLSGGGLTSLLLARGADIPPRRREELKPATGALGLSFFLLGFGVLVGPINLFVFAPTNRRQRLFVTVPVISLAAAVLMAGYIVVKDGFGGAGSQHGLVWLLPETNQAVVTQKQIARTGVLLGDGFALPDDVMLDQTIQDGNGRHYRGNTSDSRRYERAPGAAGGDWFASRRMQEHTLTRLAPTRARVELVAGGRGDSAPVVQSSVGAALRDFRYLDASGRAWVAEAVPPGQRITLRAAGDAVETTGMRPGTFAALGGAAEGLAPIPTLKSIRWDDPEFLYAGPLTGARTP